MWNAEKKRFSCDPNRCKKLSDWLLKHATGNAVNPQEKMVQYIV